MGERHEPDELLELAKELYVDAGEPHGPAEDADAVRRWVFDVSARSRLMPELELRLLTIESRLAALERERKGE